MNKCLSLVHLITITLVPLHMASAQSELPQARIVNLNIDPEQVVVLVCGRDMSARCECWRR